MKKNCKSNCEIQFQTKKQIVRDVLRNKTRQAKHEENYKNPKNLNFFSTSWYCFRYFCLNFCRKFTDLVSLPEAHTRKKILKTKKYAKSPTTTTPTSKVVFAVVDVRFKLFTGNKIVKFFVRQTSTLKVSRTYPPLPSHIRPNVR